MSGVTVTEECMPPVRWITRPDQKAIEYWVGTGMGQSDPVETVLQQQWKITTYKWATTGGFAPPVLLVPTGITYEWRDVPTVSE